MNQYTLLVTLWIAWCTLHSAMITPALTETLRSRFPSAFRYYRIFFNLEERKLKARFGTAYTDYQQRVSIFLPIKWVRHKLGNRPHSFPS